MQMHLYTTFDNMQKLQKREPIEAWLKHQSSKSDVHISLDLNEWQILEGDTPFQFRIYPLPRRRR